MSIKDRYVIVECTNTLEFMLWGAGAYEVWAPTEFRKVIRGRNGDKKVVEERCAALPGYAFVPLANFPEMRRHVPSRFRMTVFRFDALGRPCTCTLKELQVMDSLLKDDIAANMFFAKGETVRLLSLALLGLDDLETYGTVERVKQCGDAVVRLASGTLTQVSRRYLQKTR